ncbi:hypothetical protein Prudu_009181 [Prunus dulcis]|uniref:Uncharacterized protein n=1 Tax=Prunus dulcis TaxID=3755 RepID=A0A4Y1R5V7_PRUDU|nr:hypothetical protein Prudu_009181 [Prunus dulcis]
MCGSGGTPAQQPHAAWARTLAASALSPFSNLTLDMNPAFPHLDLQLGGDEQEESEGCDEVAADSISEAVVWGQIGVETPQSLTVHVLKVQVEGLNYLDWEQNSWETCFLARLRSRVGVSARQEHACHWEDYRING